MIRKSEKQEIRKPGKQKTRPPDSLVTHEGATAMPRLFFEEKTEPAPPATVLVIDDDPLSLQIIAEARGRFRAIERRKKDSQS